MYEPTEWKKGDVVTSAKLNKLEQGVANAVLVVNATSEIVDDAMVSTLDKTWQEIADAPFAVIKLVDPEAPDTTLTYSVYAVHEEDGVYAINAEGGGLSLELACGTADDYPSTDFSDDGGGGDDDPPTT